MKRRNGTVLRGVVLILVLAALAGLSTFLARGIPIVDVRFRQSGFSRLDSLSSRDGIHLVGLDVARAFLGRGEGPVLDARTAEDYRAGHIPGARPCNVYQLDRYLPELLNSVPLDRPLLLYCRGEECEDSRFLAQSLQEVGYRRLYVYTGGYNEWSSLGLPVEKGAPPAEDATQEADGMSRVLDLGSRLPGWFWSVADMLILGLGLLVGLQILRRAARPRLFGLSLRFVGLLFVAASVHKLAAPAEFARMVDNYHILPWYLVNLTAMVFPWIELTGGLLLMAGWFRAPAGTCLAGLTGIFILAVGYNLAQGLQFDCGCFGGEHSQPWQVLSRDTGLLLSCLPALIPRRAGGA